MSAQSEPKSAHPAHGVARDQNHGTAASADGRKHGASLITSSVHNDLETDWKTISPG